jgi:protein-S-isoprenylcysteine O-methyltransferase Ste14
MGEAIKIVLYSLLNIYNDGENAHQGCGCLTIIGLFLFGGFMMFLNESSAPAELKVTLCVILIIALSALLIWLTYIWIKQWWDERNQNNGKD